MKNYLFKFMLLIGILSIVSCNQEKAVKKNETGKIDRTVLPLKEPTPPVYTELDVRNATPPPRFQVEAPEGAPNVVLVLIDDLGFAGTSAGDDLWAVGLKGTILKYMIIISTLLLALLKQQYW